jgi:hypothetical protein
MELIELWDIEKQIFELLKAKQVPSQLIIALISHMLSLACSLCMTSQQFTELLDSLKDQFPNVVETLKEMQKL